MVKERERLHFGELFKAFWSESESQEIPEMDEALKDEKLLTDKEKAELKKALKEVEKMEVKVSTIQSKPRNRKIEQVKENVKIVENKSQNIEKIVEDERER